MIDCKHNFKLTGTHLRFIASTPARINEFTCEHCGQRHSTSSRWRKEVKA